MLSKILVAIVSFVMTALSVAEPFPEVSPMEVPADDSFVPVLRFVVSSDSHVRSFGDIGCERIMKMIETGYAAGEADSNYSALDAAVLVGDMTNDGKPSQFSAIRDSVNHVLKDETDFLAVAAKNHDGYLGRICRQYASAISGDPADFDKVINGYHLIGISASPLLVAHYTQSQLRWLDKTIADAVAQDPSKPVFVFQHEHIYDTVYGSYEEDTWGVKFFTDILKKYPQVIDISGHSHYPANDPRAIWQDEFTAINDGGLSYYEFTIDGAKSQHPESSDNMAHCLLVEVDAQNRVKIRVCDLNANAVMAEYMIDNVAEPKKTKYSQSERRAAATAPVFESELTAEQTEAGVVIKTDAAKAGEGDVAFIYRLEIRGVDNNRMVAQKKLGDYYKNVVPSPVSFTVNGLEPGTYMAKLVAESAWGVQSKPITVEFTVTA